MSARLVTRCDICGGKDLELVLDLGASPATCRMAPVGRRPVTEEFHPLELLRCWGCRLVFLSARVDPSELFPDDFPYSSGNSPALHDNFAKLAATCEVGLDDLVADIGANDGTLLSKFSCRTVGVEPTVQAEKTAGPVYRSFFTEELARAIVKEHGQAKVVTACNTLAHVDDIHDVMRGIDVLLAPDGTLVTENHDLKSVVDGQWDTVYHEHLRFFDPPSFSGLLARYGFRIDFWHEIPTHGGSFRTYATRGEGRVLESRPYNFAELRGIAAYNRVFLRGLDGPLVGIGATARATTVINYCGLDVEDIEFVCEVTGSDKIGRFIPGTRIPVVDENKLGDRDAVLFSWHLADVIVPKLRERGYKGAIYTPMGETL